MEAAPTRRSFIRLTVIRSYFMGLETGVSWFEQFTTNQCYNFLDEILNTGGIDTMTFKGRPGQGRRVKLECLRDLLCRVKNAD